MEENALYGCSPLFYSIYVIFYLEWVYLIFVNKHFKGERIVDGVGAEVLIFDGK